MVTLVAPKGRDEAAKELHESKVRSRVNKKARVQGLRALLYSRLSCNVFSKQQEVLAMVSRETL